MLAAHEARTSAANARNTADERVNRGNNKERSSGGPARHASLQLLLASRSAHELDVLNLGGAELAKNNFFVGEAQLRVDGAAFREHAPTAH